MVVVLGRDGVSDFDALHSGKRNERAQLCLLATTRTSVGFRSYYVNLSLSSQPCAAEFEVVSKEGATAAIVVIKGRLDLCLRAGERSVEGSPADCRTNSCIKLKGGRRAGFSRFCPRSKMRSARPFFPRSVHGSSESGWSQSLLPFVGASAVRAN